MEHRKNDLIKLMKDEGLFLKLYHPLTMKQLYIFSNDTNVVVASDDLGFWKIRRFKTDEFKPVNSGELTITVGDIDFVFKDKSSMDSAHAIIDSITTPQPPPQTQHTYRLHNDLNYFI